MKPWGTLEPPIPPSQAHRLSLDKEDSSAPLPVDTRGLEARHTGDVHAELGAKCDEGQAIPAKVSAAAFLEKFNNPLTKIEQEQLKLYALQKPRDKSLTRMVKRLVGLTEKLARGQKRSSKKLKVEEEEDAKVKQEDTSSLRELAVDWARENTGEQKEGEIVALKPSPRRSLRKVKKVKPRPQESKAEETMVESKIADSTRSNTANLLRQAISELEDENYLKLKKEERRQVLVDVIRRTRVQPQVNRTDSVLKSLRERFAGLGS